MSEQYSIVMVNNGHLGYFHMLGVMNKAAVHICVQVFVWICIFSFGIYLREELLDHMIAYV